MKRMMRYAGLSLMMLASNAIYCGNNQKKENKEVNKEAVAQLDTYTKNAMISSIIAIVTGKLIKNDALMGIGLGTAGGISAAVIQKNYHWILVWLAESFGRDALARKLCSTNPDSVEVPQAQLNVALQVEKFFNPDLSPEELAFRMAQHHKNLQKAGATRVISLSAQGASWLSYLVYRYLEHKAEQPA